jgi:3-deoxy-D-manno-octulosonate 8-phosphate phosphatase KdsC-like HAD superfamily phosphatase
VDYGHVTGVPTARIPGRPTSLGAASKLELREHLRQPDYLEQCSTSATTSRPPICALWLAVTVPNASAPMKHAHYVTRAHGGSGAVRELCELILSAQGELESRLKAYSQ